MIKLKCLNTYAYEVVTYTISKLLIEYLKDAI